MQLVKIDPLDPQPPQTHLHALAEILWAAHRVPLVRALSGEATLGRDHKPFRIGVERVGDQLFTVFGP